MLSPERKSATSHVCLHPERAAQLLGRRWIEGPGQAVGALDPSSRYRAGLRCCGSRPPGVGDQTGQSTNERCRLPPKLHFHVEGRGLAVELELDRVSGLLVADDRAQLVD
jgi:hypothetical protein